MTIYGVLLEAGGVLLANDLDSLARSVSQVSNSGPMAFGVWADAPEDIVDSITASADALVADDMHELVGRITELALNDELRRRSN